MIGHLKSADPGAGEMEEAYRELYQQFLQLRSLCLRQAELLHQLTTALQKQKGATVLNGELSDMMSISVQCTQEIPVYFHENPQPLTVTARNHAAQCSSVARNVGTLSDILTEDMSKLCVKVPRQIKEDEKLDQKVAPLLSLNPSRWQGTCSSFSKNVLEAHHLGGDRVMHTVRMSASASPSQADDFKSECGGLLMSDVALQSHVCEFCQAVFPGDTSTRGEFLRHLYTHIM